MLLLPLAEDPEEEKEIGSVVTRCGGDTGALKIAETLSGWLSVEEMINWAIRLQQIVLVQDAAISNLMRNSRPNLKLLDNVLVTDPGWPGIINTRPAAFIDWPPYGKIDPGRSCGSLNDLVVRSVANAWEMELPDLISASSFSTDNTKFSEEIGEEAEERVSVSNVDVLRREPG